MATCKPCQHHQRSEIDKAIINGVALRTIAATYTLSLGSIHRHKQHVRDLVNKAMAARDGKDVRQGTPLLHRLEEVVKVARALVGHASREGQYATANQALGTIVRCAELMARASGELQTPGLGGIHFHNNRTVNMAISVNDDTEIAKLVYEATDGFNPSTLQRLKLLAEASEPTAVVCLDSKGSDDVHDESKELTDEHENSV